MGKERFIGVLHGHSGGVLGSWLKSPKKDGPARVGGKRFLLPVSDKKFYRRTTAIGNWPASFGLLAHGRAAAARFQCFLHGSRCLLMIVAIGVILNTARLRDHNANKQFDWCPRHPLLRLFRQQAFRGIPG